MKAGSTCSSSECASPVCMEYQRQLQGVGKDWYRVISG